MPRLLLFITIITLLFSCSSPAPKQKIDLAHKAFLTSDKMDSTCGFVPLGTDVWQEIYFLNDSVFMKVYSGCCAGPGEDFANEAYYKGTYQLTDENLFLTYDPHCVVHYSKTDSVMSADSTFHVQERTETERVEPGTIKYTRLDCGAAVYFLELDGEFANHYISPVNDSFNKRIDALKAEGIWEKLFPGK